MASEKGAPSYIEAQRQSSVVATAGLSNDDDAAVLGTDGIRLMSEGLSSY